MSDKRLLEWKAHLSANGSDDKLLDGSMFDSLKFTAISQLDQISLRFGIPPSGSSGVVVFVQNNFRTRLGKEDVYFCFPFGCDTRWIDD